MRERWKRAMSWYDMRGGGYEGILDDETFQISEKNISPSSGLSQ